jgi:hypothetical protein
MFLWIQEDVTGWFDKSKGPLVPNVTTIIFANLSPIPSYAFLFINPPTWQSGWLG